MIPPLFAQYNEDLGNRLNAGRPADDFATWGEALSRKMAGVVAAYGTSEDPRGYGEKSRTGCSRTCSLIRWAHRHVRLYRMERPFPYRQRTQCHVLHRGEYSHQPWDRQGIGDIEAIEDIPLRSGCGLRIDRLDCARLIHARSSRLQPEPLRKAGRSAPGPFFSADRGVTRCETQKLTRRSSVSRRRRMLPLPDLRPS